MTRVGVVSDSYLARCGLVAALQRGDGVGLEVALLELDDLWDHRTKGSEVVLVHARSRAFAGMAIEALGRLRRADLTVGIVVIDDHGGEVGAELLRCTSRGVAVLDGRRLAATEDVVQAIGITLHGQTAIQRTVVPPAGTGRGSPALDLLTEREHEVLALMAEGLSNGAIAARLGLSAKGVEKHSTAIFRKLGLRDVAGLDRRTAAVLRYLAA